ncbi:MAG: ABC transporter substrate binding protein [Candidatus Sedimenticola sp. (ex Thyasira tokunagai)]
MSRLAILVVLAIAVVAILIMPPIIRTDTKSVGISGWGTNPEFGRSIAGFKEGLAENGFVEGENIRFILKNSETDTVIQRQIIESFAKEEVDLIFSLTTPGTLIAKEVTDTIPIVFSVVTYPVEAGVIHSLDSSAASHGERSEGW